MLYDSQPAGPELPPEVAQMRRDYAQAQLDTADVAADPFVQFERWFQDAVQAGPVEPNAMHLATADASGRPSGRMVLLKGVSPAGFAFFSNYHSRKGQQLAENPHAALTFFWPELERQVRVEGLVRQMDAADSDAYFASRPRGSRVGAVASPQSAVLRDRDELEQRFAEVEAAYPEGDIPRPAHWGGYVLSPVLIEFWQGRSSRLHDRVVYELQSDGTWGVFRLAP